MSLRPTVFRRVVRCVLFFFFFFEEASNFRGCYKLGVQRLKPKEGLEKKNGNSRIVSEQKGAAFCYGFIASG